MGNVTFTERDPNVTQTGHPPVLSVYGALGEANRRPPMLRPDDVTLLEKYAPVPGFPGIWDSFAKAPRLAHPGHFEHCCRLAIEAKGYGITVDFVSGECCVTLYSAPEYEHAVYGKNEHGDDRSRLAHLAAIKWVANEEKKREEAEVETLEAHDPDHAPYYQKGDKVYDSVSGQSFYIDVIECMGGNWNYRRPGSPIRWSCERRLSKLPAPAESLDNHNKPPQPPTVDKLDEAIREMTIIHEDLLNHAAGIDGYDVDAKEVAEAVAKIIPLLTEFRDGMVDQPVVCPECNGAGCDKNNVRCHVCNGSGEHPQTLAETLRETRIYAQDLRREAEEELKPEQPEIVGIGALSDFFGVEPFGGLYVVRSTSVINKGQVLRVAESEGE